MGLGVLEPRSMEHVPGTTRYFDDDPSRPHFAAPSARHGLKCDTSGRIPIILIPQPSDNPDDPLTWPLWRRDLITFVLSLTAVFAASLGPILAADTVTIALLFTESFTRVALLTGYFLLGAGAAAVFFVPSARVWGKRHLFVFGLAVLVASSAWAGALRDDYESFVVARVLQGIGCAPWESLVGAAVADLYFVHERGVRMAVANLAVFGGAFCTPIVVGEITHAMGWWWTFNFVAIFCGVMLFAVVLLCPETAYRREDLLDLDLVTTDDITGVGIVTAPGAGTDGPPLPASIGDEVKEAAANGRGGERASPLREMATLTDSASASPEASTSPEASASPEAFSPASGSPVASTSPAASASPAASPAASPPTSPTAPPPTSQAAAAAADDGNAYTWRNYRRSLDLFSAPLTDTPYVKLLLRPFPLFFHPAIFWACLIQGTMVGWTVFIGVVVAALFQGPPHFWTEVEAGHAYAGAFVGALLGFVLSGLLADWSVRLMTRHNGGVYEPEFRIALVAVMMVVGCAGLYGFGITVDPATSGGYHYSVPLVFFGLEVAGMVTGTVASSLYIVDAYRDLAVEAFTTMIIFKNLFSFFLTFYAYDWVVEAGPERVLTAIASVQVGVCLTSIPMYVYGKRIRAFFYRHDTLAYLRLR